jgi:hypothetical protein
MLDKLNRNKIFFTFLLFCLISCKKVIIYETDVFCPNNGLKITVRYTRAKEINEAFINADKEKKFYKTSEQYTVVKLKNNRSFKIDKLSPEDALKCSLNERIFQGVDKNYHQYN